MVKIKKIFFFFIDYYYLVMPYSLVFKYYWLLFIFSHEYEFIIKQLLLPINKYWSNVVIILKNNREIYSNCDKMKKKLYLDNIILYII